MKKLRQFILVIIAVIVLSSCTKDRYSPIDEHVSLAATVNIKDMTITFIDLEKKTRMVDWEMKKPYTGAVILPDGDSLLLYGKQVETVDLYSLKSGSLIDSWETGKGIVNGKLLKTSSTIALVDQNLSEIRFFDFEGVEQWEVRTERNPLTILESEANQKLFVLSFNKEILTVIDLNKQEKLNGFPIHPSAAGAWLIENRNEIWIGGHGAGAEIEKNIHVYDSQSGEFKRNIAAPLMPVNFLGYADHVFVLSHGTSMLYKLNENGEVLESVIVGANPFEMIVRTDQLLIAGYDSNDLHIIQPDSLERMKTIPVGNGPFQIVLRER
ncbi:PBP1b-binding outer membrane lipoprotein LpoB [Cytobacillus eiseniae]|uniref:PBP1b-binding outer membrane lipoprotein LpoB n=1 Tax=Cytobacillus eiseniae TaxID=762947 RepID=A0ABS4RE87_9BACI|nr:hypothetical protein [Cytobacillus eiseniae]MBP2241212.1 PBP1b-binding outer membrane lipoprotein LpoB [Cytobacillus eiseniae]